MQVSFEKIKKSKQRNQNNSSEGIIREEFHLPKLGIDWLGERKGEEAIFAKEQLWEVQSVSRLNWEFLPFWRPEPIQNGNFNERNPAKQAIDGEPIQQLS